MRGETPMQLIRQELLDRLRRRSADLRRAHPTDPATVSIKCADMSITNASRDLLDTQRRVRQEIHCGKGPDEVQPLPESQSVSLLRSLPRCDPLMPNERAISSDIELDQSISR